MKTSPQNYVSRVRLWKVAGYESILWEHLRPDLNFVVGVNGAGKSTVLQALALGLNYLAGKHAEDLLSRTYPDAKMEIEMTGGACPSFTFSGVQRIQGGRVRDLPVRVLQFVENRQPKNTVGEGRSALTKHPTGRYADAVSEIRHLLRSRSSEDQALARQVLHLCKSLSFDSRKTDWSWIENAIVDRGPRRARPVSCGQFDLLAVVLDLLRFKRVVEEESTAAVVLMDNPETYLHPACQEPLLKQVFDLLPEAQVFVASHSLRLLYHREPKSVFWMSREMATGSGDLEIKSLRELGGKARNAFYELYGNDPSSAILSLLYSLDSPEYFKFLLETALDPAIVSRPDPSRDKQMVAVRTDINFRRDCVVLDYGSGHGDLLEALMDWKVTGGLLTYVAVDKEEPPLLDERLSKARAQGAVSAESRVASELSEAPRECDVVVLCNVCHEISLPDLPKLLARLLKEHLRDSASSRIVIHEVETLLVGERNFVMWTPRDYSRVFADLDGIKVDERSSPKVDDRLTLNATVIRMSKRDALPTDLESILVARFRELLATKKRECLAELRGLFAPRERQAGGLKDALRQRRVAFLEAQVVNICLLEAEGGGAV